MADVAVVHLVRRKNGIAPFERFLRSYLQYPAGHSHELVLLLKGFPPGDGLPDDYERLLSGVAHRRLFVSDRGLDLNAYFTAAEQLDYAYFCFLNSYSRILAPDWLDILYRWISKEGTGLVGATGSWQRMGVASEAYRQQASSLPMANRFAMLRRRVLARWQQGAILRHAGFWVLRAAGIWRPERDFPPFPNYHLRTNAFMAARHTLRRMRVGTIATKLSAYRFESGNDSFTNQVRRLGLRVLVVGRDGEAYEPERWHLSNTFRQSRQENLLVTDNQTDEYQAADPALRSELSRDAWGEWARPG